MKENYEVPDKESGEDIEPINQFTYFFVKGLIQDLQGKMYTLVEATVSDPTQRKAAKDIVRDHIHAKLNWLFEAAHFVEVDTNYPHEIIPIQKNFQVTKNKDTGRFEVAGKPPVITRTDKQLKESIENLTQIVKSERDLTDGNVKYGN